MRRWTDGENQEHFVQVIGLLGAQQGLEGSYGICYLRAPAERPINVVGEPRKVETGLVGDDIHLALQPFAEGAVTRIEQHVHDPAIRLVELSITREFPAKTHETHVRHRGRWL